MSLFESLQSDTVRELGIDEPLLAAPSDTVDEVISAMREAGVGCALIQHPGGRLAGVFTARDMLARLMHSEFKGDMSVEGVMTPDPVTVGPGDRMRDVVSRMNGGGFRHLPVVEADGTVVGVVSARRVVRYFIEHFPNAVYTLPPSPVQGSVAREGA